jgi:hypothetical protein
LLFQKVAQHGATLSGTDSPSVQALGNHSMVREHPEQVNGRKLAGGDSPASYVANAVAGNGSPQLPAPSQEQAGPQAGANHQAGASHQANANHPNGAHSARSSRRQAKVSRKR